MNAARRDLHATVDRIDSLLRPHVRMETETITEPYAAEFGWNVLLECEGRYFLYVHETNRADQVPHLGWIAEEVLGNVGRFDQLRRAFSEYHVEKEMVDEEEKQAAELRECLGEALYGQVMDIIWGLDFRLGVSGYRAENEAAEERLGKV